MNDPRVNAFVQSVVDTVSFGMEFDTPSQETVFRSSCADLVKLHLDAARGDTTPSFYMQQIVAHDALRRAMRAHIHHLNEIPGGRELALYLAHAEHLARKRS